MGTLADILLDESRKVDVVEDCAQLIKDEVASKKGVSGMVIKTGFKGFVSLRPGIVQEACLFLLEDFVQVLDSHYERYKNNGSGKRPSLEIWMKGQADIIAEDLLGVADAMVEKSDKKSIKGTYKGMRKTGKKNVKEAMPALAGLIKKYVGK